jgi:anti-sigma factor RsiW
MTCREAMELWLDYLDDRLPLESRMALDDHLGRCPPCVQYLASYRTTVEVAAASHDDVSVDDPACQELIAEVLAALNKPERRAGG